MSITITAQGFAPDEQLTERAHYPEEIGFSSTDVVTSSSFVLSILKYLPSRLDNSVFFN